MKPRVFIASSAESLEVALAIQADLVDVAEVTVWNQDLFDLSEYTLERLLEILPKMDFGVFVFAPDDEVNLRGQHHPATRDNVIFEMGLFTAKLGKDCVVIVKCRDIENFRMPSDLAGLSTADYEGHRSDDNLAAALGPACRKIRRKISAASRGKSGGYLERYVGQEEPPLLSPNRDVRVGYQRGYKLILHMFRTENIHSVCAFDLAFERWNELLRSEYSQALNISNELFQAIERMFEQGRCNFFRRILVISHEQLNGRNAPMLLNKFKEQESAWSTKYPQASVQTKVLIYPDKSNFKTREEIQRLHDFVVFSGNDGEKLAVVETTLTSPNDRVEHPEFQVTTLESEIDRLQIGFDFFWTSSLRIERILDSKPENKPGADASFPAWKALERFLDEYPQIDASSAVIIEAGYLDLRAPNDENRLHHLNDAFYLLNALQNACPNMQGNIFLDAFINDLSSPNVCQILSCNVKMDSGDDEKRKIIDDALTSLRRSYEANNLKNDDFELFSMKKTRNDVTKTIKGIVASGRPGVWIRDSQEMMVDIYADARSGEICLGYQEREAGSTRVIPRCTALMAQHYFELFRFALKKRPQLKELWIFDFNLLTESDAVRQGAEASFVLHSWPVGFKLCIVNCIYYSDGKTGKIHVIKGPA